VNNISYFCTFKNLKLKKSIVLIFIVLLIDQCIKIYIKTHFLLGQEIEVFSWFRIHFVENYGMAWGTEIGGKSGKLFLTVFRLFAVTGIGYWLVTSIKKQASTVLIFAISLIFAGALGNIIDSVFYGVLFNDSLHSVATFLPVGGGYSSLFYGKVVDMLYFPIINTELPQWIPLIGGHHFTFFDPVFNIADSSISIGVILLILFNKKSFPKEKKEYNSENSASTPDMITHTKKL